jgi:hypothetical protein
LPVEGDPSGHISRKSAFVEHGKPLAVHISFFDTRDQSRVLMIQFGVFVKYNQHFFGHIVSTLTQGDRPRDSVMRSGEFVKQVEGYRAYHPAKLPPSDPPIQYETELIRLLTEADRSLGRLDGVTSILPNPDLFVAMYVKQEAVLSSQIEGTQSTLEDVLQFAVDAKGQDRPKDVKAQSTRPETTNSKGTQSRKNR